MPPVALSIFGIPGIPMSNVLKLGVVLKLEGRRALSIKPIRVRATDDYEGDLPSPETINAYIKAVIDLHSQQRANNREASDKTVNLRTSDFVESLKRNGSRRDVMLAINHRSSKVTHGGREAGARHAHASRASIEDITHHDNWNHHRLVTHYLTQVSKEVPYEMAGFTLPKEEFWLERNTVILPKELQKMIFPFIEDLFPGNKDWSR
ncbi:MAG: hypothetical protein J3Q66DRAFT_413873 [Benniella sp.]|nr:MAG: hypothetical protein J3Q66DRAFT_413873 [Benniella sp.]